MKKDDFEKAIERLERPFAIRDLEWVPNFTYPKNGNYNNKVIAVSPYVRRESVITRLNVVLGPGNWENMVEPLGKYGLYQGISVKKQGEWIRKFDGSQISDSGGRIDAVKGVVSKSLRRGGEVWGVGLYLQFVPQLYAVKRPSDYYDAQEKWTNGDGLEIRWDPPQMPKMFLPEYMTPEQYVRMKRIVRYFSEEKQEAAKELIRKWENDPESIPYEKAQQTVGLVWDRVIDRLNSMDNSRIVDPGTKEDNDKNPPSQKNDTPKGQSESKGSKKQEPKKEKENEVPENAIRAKRWKELRKMVKDLEKLDEDAIWYEKDWLEELKSKIVAHRNQVEYITDEDYKKYRKSISEIIDTIDDDLPF